MDEALKDLRIEYLIRTKRWKPLIEWLQKSEGLTVRLLAMDRPELWNVDQESFDVAHDLARVLQARRACHEALAEIANMQKGGLSPL